MLITMRVFFLGIVSGAVVALLPITLLHRGHGSISLSVGMWVVLTVGAISLAGVLWLRHRPLSGGSVEEVLFAYRTTYVRSLFLAESPCVIGVFVSVATGHVGTYLAAILVAVPGVSMAAPTTAALVRRQEQLDLRGAPVDLVGLLTGRPASVSDAPSGPE